MNNFLNSWCNGERRVIKHSPLAINQVIINTYDSKKATNYHLIDNDSGIGLQVVNDDLNNDGKQDIINSNKKGVILFLQD